MLPRLTFTKDTIVFGIFVHAHTHTYTHVCVHVCFDKTPVSKHLKYVDPFTSQSDTSVTINIDNSSTKL